MVCSAAAEQTNQMMHHHETMDHHGMDVHLYAENHHGKAYHFPVL